MSDEKKKTKKIKIKMSLAGERKSFAPGDVVDWEAEDAQRLIDAGHAEEVVDGKKKKDED
jgi:hypothetical protein